MKNPRKQTFQESGVTIQPLTSLSSSFKKCKVHEYELKEDGQGYRFYQCKVCFGLK